MATWPTVIGCEVALRLAKISGDSEDTDTNPDWAPEVGSRIVLSPSIAGQLVVYSPNDGSRPIVVKVMSVNAVVGEDGFMYQPSPDDPTVASQRKVYVLPTDDDRLSVTGWTWTLRMDGGAIGPFSAPSGGVAYLSDYVTAPAVDQTKYWVDRIPDLLDTMNSAIGAGAGAVEAAAQAKTSATSAATSAQTATNKATEATNAANSATTTANNINNSLALANVMYGEGFPWNSTNPDVSKPPSLIKVGTEYVDTAVTNGAYRWRIFKTTKSVNNYWVCVDGDTDWVSLVPIIDPNAGVIPQQFIIRRINQSVYLRIDVGLQNYTAGTPFLVKVVSDLGFPNAPTYPSPGYRGATFYSLDYIKFSDSVNSTITYCRLSTSWPVNIYQSSNPYRWPENLVLTP